jgi:hypothetical protein
MLDISDLGPAGADALRVMLGVKPAQIAVETVFVDNVVVDVSVDSCC